MKTFFRVAMLVAIVATCYCVGRRHGVQTTQVQAAEETRRQNAALAAAAKQGPKHPKFDTIRAILTDPNLTWAEKKARLYAQLPGKGDGDPFGEVVTLLSEINPADIPNLLRLLKDLPAEGEDVKIKNALLVAFFDKLDNKDPLLTLSLLEFYPDANARTEKMAEALGVLAGTDPQKALSMLAELPPGDSNYEDFFSSWAATKPAEAAATALSLPPGHNRNTALQAIGENWAGLNPLAAMEWAKTLPATDKGIRNFTIQHALGNLAESDFFDLATAVAAFNSINDPAMRQGTIGFVISQLGTKNPALSLDWINQTTAPETHDYYTGVNTLFSIMNFGSDENFGNATALVNKITDPIARTLAINALANHIYGDQALSWIQTLPNVDDTTRTDAINKILGNMAQYNPTQAMAFVQNATDSSTYLDAVPAIAQNLAKDDPQGALSWVNGLPEGADRDKAIGNILATMAKTDVTAAWNYAASLPAGSNQDTAMTSIVSTMAQKDPVQAVSLADEMPAGTAQVAAISSIAQTWVQQDPAAFTGWLNTLPTGDARDQAVLQLAMSRQVYKDPAAVLAWANTVGNAKLRANQIENILNTWAERDAPAALNAAQTVNLPDDQKAALIQKLTPTPGK